MKKLLISLAVLVAAFSIDSHAQGNVGVASSEITSTVAKLPPAASCKTDTSACIRIVTDGNSSTDCTTGTGSTRVQCSSNGTAWAALGGGGGSGFTAPSGWQVNPLGDQGNWATAGNWSLDNTVTLTADTTGTASLWNGTATITPAAGHDVKLNLYTANITGGGAGGGSDTYSNIYHQINYNINSGTAALGHAFGTVFRVGGTSTAGSVISQLTSLYASMGLTNQNGATTVMAVGDYEWDTLSGTGTISEMDTLKVGAPGAITGTPTVTASAILNLGDASAAAMPGTSKSSLAVGGIVSGKKAMVTITASNGAGLDNMLIVGSGAPSQIKGGLIVSAAVNTVASLFSGEDANDTFGVVVNGQNSFHFSYDGTGAFEWGVSTGAGSDFVLRSPGRSVNNIRINRTTGVLTWNDYKSSSGTRFLCVDSSGVMTASASACSGT
jgi:hypothetical protein